MAVLATDDIVVLAHVGLRILELIAARDFGANRDELNPLIKEARDRIEALAATVPPKPV
jgi:hypothetical protein